MMKNPSSNDTALQAYEPSPAGEVFSLFPDWAALLALLPELKTAATIYRGRHAMFCRQGAFQKLTLSHDSAYTTEGIRGESLNLAHWSEAWWYEEPRQEEMIPCLEIADDQGKGLLKLCYPDRETGLRDRAVIEPLFEKEATAWDLIHLRKSNQMSCFQSHRLRNAAPFREPLRAILHEAFMRQVELGIALSHHALTLWEALPPSAVNTACCWLATGRQGLFLHMEPAGYHYAEVCVREGRSIVFFYDTTGQRALTLIEPDGVPFQSIFDLREILPTLNLGQIDTP